MASKVEFRVVFNSREKVYWGPFYNVKNAIKLARKRAAFTNKYITVQARDVDQSGGVVYGTSWTDVRTVAPPSMR